MAASSAPGPAPAGAAVPAGGLSARETDDEYRKRAPGPASAGGPGRPSFRVPAGPGRESRAGARGGPLAKLIQGAAALAAAFLASWALLDPAPPLSAQPAPPDPLIAAEPGPDPFSPRAVPGLGDAGSDVPAGPPAGPPAPDFPAGPPAPGVPDGVPGPGASEKAGEGGGPPDSPLAAPDSSLTWVTETDIPPVGPPAPGASVPGASRPGPSPLAPPDPGAAAGAHGSGPGPGAPAAERGAAYFTGRPPGYLVSAPPGSPGAPGRAPLPGRPLAVFFDGPPAYPPAHPPRLPGPLKPPAAPSLFGRRNEAYERAVAFIQEERYAEALSFIRRSPRDIRGWTGLMGLEAALLSRGDPREALVLYDRILGSKERGGIHWVRGLTGYKFLLNDLRSRGDYAALFRLVQCLSFEWRNVEARELIAEAMKDPGLPDATREEMARMDAIMAMRHGDYESAERHFAGRGDRSSLRWLATLRLRQGDFRGSAEARRAAALTLKGAPRLREYQRALECLTKGGMPDEAEALMEEVPDLKRTVPAWRYFMGISHMAAGEPEKAVELFAEEAKEKQERGQRAQYFQGRALEMLLRHPEAAKAYAEAAAGAFTYYRILARGRLAKLNGEGAGPSAPATRLAFMLESPTGEDRDSMAFFLWLSERLEASRHPPRGSSFEPRGGPGDGARARTSAFHYLAQGAPSRAVQELRQAPDALPRRNEVSIEEMARLAVLSAETGEYRLAIRLMARLPYDAPKGHTGPFRYNHPPGFAREALAAWRRQGVPPQLTMAVILIESAFQPDEVSASNARGLMQLLPSTAERVSQILGERPPREEELFGPGMNIRYGTCYLGLLLESFKSMPLALASYNGGPFNIKSLLAAHDGLPTDVLIETIPVSETAAYVRKNMEAVYAYEASYLGEGVLPDLTVPARMPVIPPPDF